MLVLLLGCAPESSTDDGLVTWSGWVYADSVVTDSARLTDGSLAFSLAPYDSEPTAAEVPYPDFPGYFQVDVPPATPVNVRVTSSATRPTVWSGDTPGTSGQWFSGALYGVTDAGIEATFEALGEDGDVWRALPADGLVLVMGQPFDDTLRCEDLTVDGAAPVCWRVDGSGLASKVETGEVSWFAAAAPPGTVVIRINEAKETWQAEAGDVVMANFLSGGT